MITSKYSSIDSSTKIMGKIYTWATLVKRLTPLILIFTALILAIKIVPTHGLRIVNVDGVSMTYTFKDKEPMVVSKIGKSWSMFNGQTYIPKRGQVIIFKREQSAFLKPDELSKPSYVVKRVIALPGEKVTVKNGHVRVYTSSKPKGFDPDKGAVWEKTMRKAGFGEDLTITVDKDEVFVLGDNRTGSIDSRYNGPVKLNDIYGHVRWHGKLTSLKSA